MEEIYQLYQNLQSRQERIKPLLPLPLIDENRNAVFKLKDYSTETLKVKNNLSEYLYNNASTLLTKARNKHDYRAAYDDFQYLQKITPNYKDVTTKIDQAHKKGIDYVVVSLFNDTDKVIPQRLEADLLNFNTYGINDLWTVYHSNPQKNMKYDYAMELAFKEIIISPEQVRERQLIKEKQIKDGQKDLLDKNGNVVKDSLGKPIKVDNFKTIKASVYEFTQFKNVTLTGAVSFTDLQSKQIINSYPLGSEFVFEHMYATASGDRRALDDIFLDAINRRQVPFPSNEQMIYDAGEDIKAKLKAIISRHRFN